MINQGGRVVLQGLYFVLLARGLGVSGFGAFSGVVALIAVLAPFASLGVMNLLIRNATRDPARTALYYSTAVLVTTVSGLVMTLGLCGLATWLAPPTVGIVVVACLSVADLLGARLVDLAAAVYAPRERMLRTALFPLLLYGLRLLGLVVLVAMPGPLTLGKVAWMHVGTSVAVSVILTFATALDLGPARPEIKRYVADWREGLLFSISLSAQTVYNDIDKAMLARIGTLEATAVYTAAYRVIDMAFTPIKAVLSASYSRFFRHGAGGVDQTLRFTRRIAVPSVAYSSAASVLLFASADIVPHVLGAAYAPSVGALRGLALLPLLKALHYLAADTLTGAGYQGVRSFWQVIVALANVALNLVLIPAFSYRGAVVASLLSDGSLAVVLWLVLRGRWLRERRSSERGGTPGSPASELAAETI
jgi:O-antigen/teichoic acid export membrane protein